MARGGVPVTAAGRVGSSSKGELLRAAESGVEVEAAAVGLAKAVLRRENITSTCCKCTEFLL